MLNIYDTVLERGGHYVTLVKVPKRMNEEQREAFRQFDDVMGGFAADSEKPKKGLFK